MATGKVRSFNAHKGYGHIKPDDGSEDVFLDIVEVERAGLQSLLAGTAFSYRLVTLRHESS